MTAPPRSLRLEAFAKVNRSLVVLGRRADGFHEIETLLETVDLSDEISIEEADGLSLSCSDPSLPSGEENLVLRAARLLAGESGTRSGARIHLCKRIPAGGGLGGGSSDAASTLLGLSALWHLGLTADALAPLAARIGSDVPFFLVGGRGRGSGRGERIEPLPDAPAETLLLLFPPFGMPTADVYKALRAPGLTPPGRGALSESPAPGILPDRNDLEPAAESLRPELGALRRLLADAGARSARMSGSGSTLFGVFGTPGEASRAAAALAGLPPGTRWSVVTTVSRREFALRALPAEMVPCDFARQMEGAEGPSSSPGREGWEL